MSIDLDAIQERADAAALGPWRIERHDLSLYVQSTNEGLQANLGYVGNRPEADAEFIAHARTDIPALLAYAREQQAQLDAIQPVPASAVEAAFDALGHEPVTREEMLAALEAAHPALLAYARDLEAQRDAARSVCHEREEELMELKGSCRAPSCILHRAHRGPCHVILAALTATEGQA